MPELGKRLGELHDQAVELVVVAVLVGGEHLGRELFDLRAGGDQLHRQHVDLPRFARTHEVGQAQVPVAALAREVETQPVGADRAA
jgi:hypothetical protein